MAGCDAMPLDVPLPNPSPESAEDAVDALIDGDRVLSPGPARAALRHPVFRRVFIGAFLSNIGNWMQNVVLGAIAYDLTGSAKFVGLLAFAQLGPLLFFSLIGGVLADIFDRRRLLILVTALQASLSLVLAWEVLADDPSPANLVITVFLIGLCNAVFGPTYGALLPALVGRADLPGAISLNSAQMNGSRVIGPAIGAVVLSSFGAPWVFIINAASYLLVIWALITVTLPAPAIDTSGPRGLSRLAEGFRAARRDRVVSRSLVIIFTFSLISLAFIPQLPTLADRNLGMAPQSPEYGYLYACFGFGALLGAISIGTVLASRNLERIVRMSLVAFAVFLSIFSLLRSPVLAYPLIMLVGLAYFAMVTSLSTVFQQRLDDVSRGRVMALWIMGFGGTVPIGGLLAGVAIEAFSVTAVVLVGAGVALGLAAYADLSPGPEAPPPRQA
jgi:MFS family permease